MEPTSRTRRWLNQLLHTHDTPQRTAVALAVGVFFGFSPMLGLHTVLGLAVAFAFNLNRVAVLLGIYSNLPWILPAYYSVATLLGAIILGVEVPPNLLRDFQQSLADRSWADFRQLGATLTPLAWAYALGAGGEAAVTHMLGVMRNELRMAMALTGCTDVKDAGRDLLA